MNRKITIVSLIIIVVLIIIGISYRSNKQSASPLTIGVIAPLTGDFGAVGENVVKGMKAAQALYEANTGNKVALLIENDGADAAKGLSAYKKLTSVDHVNGLINTFTSTMDAIYPSVVQNKYPVMMEFLQANNVQNDNVFQMTLGNDHVWDRYAKHISQGNYNQSNVVIVHSVDAAQASFAKAFEAAYDKHFTDVVASTDQNGLRSDATKIASLKPSMIIFFMTPQNGAILTKDILPMIATSTQLAYDIQLTTGMSYYKQELGGDLSKINGAISLMFEGDLTSPEYKQFLAEYQKLYPGEQPGFLADYGYDTFMTYVSTYSKDDAKWLKNLSNFNGKGASGAVQFDEKGVRISPLVIKKVTGGQLETISRLGL